MEQFTFVRDGRLYHADQETVQVLQAVQTWDEGSERNAAHELFARGLANGRIGEGPAPTRGHTQAHDQPPSQGQGHDGTASPASSTQRAKAQGFEMGQ